MSANRHVTIYQEQATVQRLSRYNINLRYTKQASYCLETDITPNEGRNFNEKRKSVMPNKGTNQQIYIYTHTHTHTHTHIYTHTYIHEYNEQKNASKCLGTAHNIKSVICIVWS